MAMLAPSAEAHRYHQDTGPAIFGVAISSIIVATFCVWLRIYIRVRITQSFWWDDAFIVQALTLSVVGTAFNVLSVKSGAGKHTLDLPNPKMQVSDVVKWNTAYQIDNVICVNLVKVSILLFILRIQNSKPVAYLIWFVMATMSVVNIVAIATLAAQCRPLEKLWKPTLPGRCFHKGVLEDFGYVQGVVNVLTDFFCTLTPIVVLWRVRIKKRLKVVICGLMSLGLIATASQIVRVVKLGSLETDDYTYQITAIVISAILDQNLGIIAACIPTFQPLFKYFAESVKTIRTKGHKKSSGPHSHYSSLGDKKDSKPKQAKYRDSTILDPFKVGPAGTTLTCTANHLRPVDSDEDTLPLQILKPTKGAGYHRTYDV